MTKRFSTYPFGLLFLCLCWLWGCNPTKHLAEDERLLLRNTIVVDNPNVDKDELSSILKQQPNRNLLGFWRPYLHVYNYGKRKKRNRVNDWLMNTVGEEPVVLNSVLTQKSANQLTIYMRNKGYFRATVTDSVWVSPRNPKKTKVVYTIKAGPAYTLSSIDYDPKDSSFIPQVISASKKTLLKYGDNFDVDAFEADRTAFTNHLKNLGYFYFDKQYLSYEVDTALPNAPFKVAVNTIVRNPTRLQTLPNGKDTLITEKHRPYYISNVYIQTDYNQQDLDLRA
ncbi:MAG: POTRA domain-containing protein [Salibacteraceae bacterium]